MPQLEWTLDERPSAWWDDALLRAEDHNLFQTTGWGELNHSRHWRPLRMVAQNANGEVVGMVQILERTIAGSSIGWAPGGPVLGFPNTKLGSVLAALPRALVSIPRLSAVRFDCYLDREGATSYEFHRILRPATTRVNSGFTAWIDLKSGAEQREARWNSNHRRNLRRARELSVNVRTMTDGGLQDFLTVYDNMRSTKVLHSLPDLRPIAPRIQKIFGDDVIVMTAYHEDQAVSAALVVRSGRTAVYISGGTSKAGRDVGAGHVLFHELLTELTRRDVERFDLGGLDPRSDKSRGVDLFKLGFGGTIQERVGEWDWATGRFARTGLNLGVRLRGIRS